MASALCGIPRGDDLTRETASVSAKGGIREDYRGGWGKLGICMFYNHNEGGRNSRETALGRRLLRPAPYVRPDRQRPKHEDEDEKRILIAAAFPGLYNSSPSPVLSVASTTSLFLYILSACFSPSRG